MVSKVPFIKPSRASRPRNAFDLSQRHFFTAAPGMLLPVMTLDLLPHDHVEINARDFMRALPMNSSAFVNMRSVYEFFAVPYKQLFSAFDQVVSGMTDYRSGLLYSQYGGSRVDSIPYFVPSDFRSAFNSLIKTSKDFYRDGIVDMFGVQTISDFYRLCDLLGYGAFTHLDDIYNPTGSYLDGVKGSSFDMSGSFDAHLSPFRICAYNKIYNDYYRNTSYEPYAVGSFNLDSFVGGSAIPGTDMLSHKMWDLKYRNAGLDLLTNIRPSLSLTDVSLPSFSDLNFYSSTQVLHSDSRSSSLELTNGYISASGLRSLFAVDKLLQISNRAGKTFEEQMEAHFGVSVPKSRDGRCTYIGGFDSSFNVSDVIQSSGTTVTSDVLLGGSLGRVAGKGIGSGSGRVVFDADEHCVLMCIYSLVPELTYDASRIDPMVQKTSRFDFFTPEFENLGLQPLVVNNISFSAKNQNKIIGYQPRYSEYKTAVDVNHGQFMTSEPLSYWTSHRIHLGAAPFDSRTDVSMLKILPNCLDSVFPVRSNGLDSTDNFFGGCFFNVIKVSDMSFDGMPSI